MRERTSRRVFRAAGWLAVALVATGAAQANTVDVVHDGFGASDVTTFWAGGYDGYDVTSGVYMLTKTADTGTGSIWHNGSIPGFCVELHEPAPNATYTYDVVMPEDMYNSYTGQYLGTTKANYLRELWARYYDSAWTSGSYTDQDNRAAEAFAAAVWEIVYEDMPSSASEWDVTTDGTSGVGGFTSQDLDWETANKWLQSLTGGGAKADLRILVCNGQQNYLVAVPEPATLILLGLGGLCGVFGRRYRRTSTVSETKTTRENER